MELGFQLKSVELCTTVFEIWLVPHRLWNYVKVEGVTRGFKGFNWRTKMACWNVQIGQVLFFGFPRVGGWVLIGTQSLLCDPALDPCAVSSHLKFSSFLHFNMYGSLLVTCPAVPACFTWLQLGKIRWPQVLSMHIKDCQKSREFERPFASS